MHHYKFFEACEIIPSIWQGCGMICECQEMNENKAVKKVYREARLH